MTTKLQLKVRNLESGETLIAELDSVDDALIWLRERPRFVDVLGVLSEHLSQEQHDALRAAMRPLDDEEKALEQKIQREVEAAIDAQMEKERARAQRELAAHVERMKSADPARPMQVLWSRSEGFRLVDEYDPREVTEAAKEAITAWIAERNTWVEGRGQVVDSATVEVYPAELPPGVDERVRPGGQFTATLADD